MTQKNTNKSSDSCVIVEALRTPFAKQATDLHNLSALDLSKNLISELVTSSNLDFCDIDQIIYGQVVQMPEAPNIAREIVLGTQLSNNTDSFSVTRACATSFQAVSLADQAIKTKQAKTIIAGGADSSSVLPFGISNQLSKLILDLSKSKSLSQKFSLIRKFNLKDLKIKPPAISDYTTNLRMGDIAEQMAKKYSISRNEQDEFAHRSHILASSAWNKTNIKDHVMNYFNLDQGKIIERDNNIRFDPKLEAYQKLKPAFDKKYGSVTAGNSSALTDGASALILISESHAIERGEKILGRIKSYSYSAIDAHQDALLGPAYSVPNVLKKAKMKFSDIDYFDMHEAFSAQVLANIKCLESKEFAKNFNLKSAIIKDLDFDRFNIQGGSIAYGHPFAATGARMIMQSLNNLKNNDKQTALLSACAAGGLGVSMIVERCA